LFASNDGEKIDDLFRVVKHKSNPCPGKIILTFFSHYCAIFRFFEKIVGAVAFFGYLTYGYLRVVFYSSFGTMLAIS